MLEWVSDYLGNSLWLFLLNWAFDQFVWKLYFLVPEFQSSRVDIWRVVSFWTENLTKVLIWSFSKTEVPFVMWIETQVLKTKVSKTQGPEVYLTQKSIGIQWKKSKSFITFEIVSHKVCSKSRLYEKNTLFTTPQHAISLPTGMIRLNLKRTMHHFKGAVIYCPLKN
jgi:hypothetical protein